MDMNIGRCLDGIKQATEVVFCWLVFLVKWKAKSSVGGYGGGSVGDPRVENVKDS